MSINPPEVALEKPATPGRGLFVVVCGIDGSGKTTQEHLLAQRLEDAGQKVYQTRNPSDWYRKNPEVQEFLTTGKSRLGVETLALLAAADRMAQLDTDISPRLESGVNVICNRYVYSTFAYFRARGANIEFVEQINARVRTPDRGILITISPLAAVDRIKARDEGLMKFEERDPEYLGQVQEELIRRWPANFLKVDGSRSREQLAGVIYDYVISTSGSLS